VTTRHVKALVLGAGPAGYTAAVYLARAGLKPLIITGVQPGGQLTTTTDVENYPGFADPIQGPWLMEQMSAQAAHVGAEIIVDTVVSVDLSVTPFRLETDDNLDITCDALVIATGAKARWLGVPMEKELSGYGVSACATCDGFFYRNKEVAVIGGGNTAVEEALYLANLASKVTLVHRRNSLRAEQILQDRLFAHPRINIVWDHIAEGFIADTSAAIPAIRAVALSHAGSGTRSELSINGVFVAIGHDPATALFRNQLDIDDDGYIVTAPNSTRTSVSGVFAAGDVQDRIFRQAVTAAGSGCMAALEAEKWLAHRTASTASASASGARMTGRHLNTGAEPQRV
jgi:thioredoxin reductase (NADPH)